MKYTSIKRVNVAPEQIVSGHFGHEGFLQQYIEVLLLKSFVAETSSYNLFWCYVHSLNRSLFHRSFQFVL